MLKSYAHEPLAAPYRLEKTIGFYRYCDCVYW